MMPPAMAVAVTPVGALGVETTQLPLWQVLPEAQSEFTQQLPLGMHELLHMRCMESHGYEHEPFAPQTPMVPGPPALQSPLVQQLVEGMQLLPHILWVASQA
jgi:hypothetical protein